MDRLNPDVSAADVAEGSDEAIFDFVTKSGQLPEESARPFAAWLDGEWNTFNEDEDKTAGEVIAGALAYWRGGRWYGLPAHRHDLRYAGHAPCACSSHRKAPGGATPGAPGALSAPRWSRQLGEESGP